MAAKPSKFSSIFEAPQEPEETTQETATDTIAPIPEPETVTATATVAPEPAPAVESTSRTTTGKKSDPRYKQVTAYVRKDLHRHVTDALYDEARGREDAKRKEFSELVDELLEQWLKNRSGHNSTSN